jgi:hypothetical protein
VTCIVSMMILFRLLCRAEAQTCRRLGTGRRRHRKRQAHVSAAVFPKHGGARHCKPQRGAFTLMGQRGC